MMIFQRSMTSCRAKRLGGFAGMVPAEKAGEQNREPSGGCLAGATDRVFAIQEVVLPGKTLEFYLCKNLWI